MSLASGIGSYKQHNLISYALGMSVTMELLLHMSETVEKIFINSNTEENENTANLRELCVQHNIPIEKNDKAFNILSRKGNCFVIAAFRKFEKPLNQESHLLLVNPADVGNLGSIVRTAIGFGIHNIAFIRPAVDIFDPKTIRASMGAVFHINFEYFDDCDIYRQRFPTHEFYAFMLDAQLSIQIAEFSEPYTLVFGSEAIGLPKEYSDFCKTVVIPHSSKIESLNVAVAASIAMYVATAPKKHKQRGC